ncbi:outer membrane beta-barrel protein [Bowmanella denitrificans]
MKYRMLLLAGLTCSQLVWATTDLRVSLGYSDTDISDMGAVQFAQVDDSSVSWGLELGYEYAPGWRLFAGYQDLGHAELQIKDVVISQQNLPVSLKELAPILPSGFTLGLDARLWQHNQWLLSGSFGLYSWQADIDSRVGASRQQSHLSDTNWLMGAQLSYKFNQRWSLLTGYRHYALDEPVGEWRLGAEYRF